MHQYSKIDKSKIRENKSSIYPLIAFVIEIYNTFNTSSSLFYMGSEEKSKAGLQKQKQYQKLILLVIGTLVILLAIHRHHRENNKYYEFKPNNSQLQQYVGSEDGHIHFPPAPHLGHTVSAPLGFETNNNQRRKKCHVQFKDPNMSLCYFVPYGANFGDELGPAVAKRLLEYKFGCSSEDNSVHELNLSDQKQREVERVGRTCLFTLGSIFHYVHKGDHVWGTGINPKWQTKDKYPDRESITVHSVRGKHTAQKLQEHHLVKSAKDVDIGDPGFLIPVLYSEYHHLPTRSIGKKDGRRGNLCYGARSFFLNIL